MAPRSVRALRAVVSALVSTHVAAGFHVVGGGETPGLVTMLLVVAAATLVCLAVARARLSLPRLALSVVASQAAFHLLFQVTGTSSTLAAHSHAAVDAIGTPAPTHHAAPMAVSHLLAAAATVLLLAYGERTVLAVARVVARLVWRPDARIAAIVPASDPRLLVLPTSAERRPRPVVSTPGLRRGPPLFV